MADVEQRQGGSWLRIVSRCETAESFFATFSRYVDSESIFIATSKPKAVGEKRRIVIQLADGHTMLNGEAEVMESLPDGGGPDGRSGMRLKILSLEQRSQSVFFELMRRASARRSVGAVAAAVELRLPDPPPRATPLPGKLPLPGMNGSTAETRLPGSSITLPANPLSDVTIEDIKGFIECTIFEEAEGYEPKDADVELPFAKIDTVAKVRPDPTAPVVEPTLTTVSPAPPRGISITLAVVISLCTALAGALAAAVYFRKPPAPQPVASAPVEPEPQPEPVPVPDPASVAAVAPSPSPPAPDPAPTPEPAPIPEGTGCTATVRTAPRDAVVRWNGKKIGVTPIDAVPIPCGEATVVLDRPRHDVQQRTVSAIPGTDTRVEVTLQRPAGKLDVVTTPPGATVTVNGSTAGRSPARADVQAFTTVKVVATLPGHKPWSKTVYVRGKSYRVTADLTPAPGKKGSVARKRDPRLDALTPDR